MISKILGGGVLICASLAWGADQRGVLRVGDRCSVSLDGGHLQCVVALTNEDRDLPLHPEGKNWNFWYQATPKALYLSPLNRTMLARGQAEEAGRTGCRAAVYKHNRVRLDTLGPGSHVCVRLGDGRLAELSIEGSAKADQVSFSYVLWE